VATDRIRASFADDPIVVMVHGDLRTLLLTTELGRLLELEGCLGGNVPKGAKPYGGSSSPCAAIARSGWVKRVYGPATFINEAANQVTAAIGQRISAAGEEVSKARRAARAQAIAAGLGPTAADAAGAKAAAQAQRSAAAELAKLQVETGLSTLPTIANPDFVSQVAFDPARGLGQPKARFSYLLPAADTALVQVRPRANLSSENRRALINQVRAAVRMPQFALKGSTYAVTGSPVLAESLSDEVAQSAVPLLLIAVAVLAVVLLLAFRTRLRLIPLVVAVVVAAAVFGAMALLGLPLTVAAVGGVPVLIGLEHTASTVACRPIPVAA
jgi:predicted RND superfamily exporter protein